MTGGGGGDTSPADGGYLAARSVEAPSDSSNSQYGRVTNKINVLVRRWPYGAIIMLLSDPDEVMPCRGPAQTECLRTCRINLACCCRFVAGWVWVWLEHGVNLTLKCMTCINLHVISHLPGIQYTCVLLITYIYTAPSIRGPKRMRK